MLRVFSSGREMSKDSAGYISLFSILGLMRAGVFAVLKLSDCGGQEQSFRCRRLGKCTP